MNSRRFLVLFATAPFRTTVKHLVDQHPTALPESMLGSKLALVLHEIARSDLARSDAKLRQLAKHALAGYTSLGGQDIYTAIRDRLNSRVGVKTGGYDRAAKLATMFNWHKVSGALDFDRTLARWIKTRAKDQQAVGDGTVFRHTAHLYGQGYTDPAGQPGAPSSEYREQVLEAMRSHLAKELKGYLPSHEITRDAVMRSLNRLAHGEHAREMLTTNSEVGPKTNITRVDPAQPAYHQTTQGPRINPRRGAEQFRRRDLVRPYALRPMPDEGIVHSSHTERGQLDPDATAGVLAERSAVLHAMNVLGLVPPRQNGESAEQYAARVSVATAAMTNEIRDHIANNAFDPAVQRYVELAHDISAPEDELDPTGRIALPDAAVSTVGLSTALAPMVAQIAQESGLRPGRYPAPGGLTAKTGIGRRRVLAEYVPEPVPPEPGSADLTSPPTLEDYAADLLHAEDESGAARAAWGSGRKEIHAPTPLANPRMEFDLPDVEGLEPSLAVRAVQKAPTQPRKPALPAATRRAVYQTIADHFDSMGHVDATGRHIPPEESVVGVVQKRHGLSKRSASALVAAFHKAKAGDTLPTVPAPTERVWPPTPRPNRLSRREMAQNELWAYELPGGEAPTPPELDWRPDEMIPEDYYAMTRSRRELIGFARKPTVGAPDHMWRVSVYNPAHMTDTVRALAEQAREHHLANRYEERNAIYPILADALQDAGVTDEKFLSSLREPVPHVWNRDQLVLRMGDRSMDSGEQSRWEGHAKQYATEMALIDAHEAIVGKDSGLPVGYVVKRNGGGPSGMRGNPPPGEIWHRAAYWSGGYSHRAQHKEGRPLTLKELKDLAKQRSLERGEVRRQKIAANLTLRNIQPPPYTSDRLSRREMVARYAGSFCAPAGGMVARGTFYKGGQRIPSVGGEFLSSGRRRRKRKPRKQKPA